jgi:hypothetical protein
MKNRKSRIAPAAAATKYSAALLILPAGKNESGGRGGCDGFRGSEMSGLPCEGTLSLCMSIEGCL